MIDLEITNNHIELSDYSADATLEELRIAVEAVRSDRSLVTSSCAGCGRCCHFEHLPVLGFDLARFRESWDPEKLSRALVYPEPPAVEERVASISDLCEQHRLERTTAALIYEYNAGEPITYAKGASGGCVFLTNGFCGDYAERAFTCSLYACTMGEGLMSLQERIVRQGIWHSYFLEGWVSEEEITHNPFLKRNAYDEVLIADFDADLEAALESLFFYF